MPLKIVTCKKNKIVLHGLWKRSENGHLREMGSLPGLISGREMWLLEVKPLMVAGMKCFFMLNGAERKQVRK